MKKRIGDRVIVGAPADEVMNQRHIGMTGTIVDMFTGQEEGPHCGESPGDPIYVVQFSTEKDLFWDSELVNVSSDAWEKLKTMKGWFTWGRDRQ